MMSHPLNRLTRIVPCSYNLRGMCVCVFFFFFCEGVLFADPLETEGNKGHPFPETGIISF